MHLASDFHWSVDDEHGNQLIEIHGTTNDDYVYGMAGGYVGSYQYTGRFRGEPVARHRLHRIHRHPLTPAPELDGVTPPAWASRTCTPCAKRRG